MRAASAILILFVLIFVLALPGEAFSEELRVYIGGAIVIGGLSIFFSFVMGGHHAGNETEGVAKVAEAADECGAYGLEAYRLAYKNPLPPGEAGRGMVTLLSW